MSLAHEKELLKAQQQQLKALRKDFMVWKKDHHHSSQEFPLQKLPHPRIGPLLMFYNHRKS